MTENIAQQQRPYTIIMVLPNNPNRFSGNHLGAIYNIYSPRRGVNANRAQSADGVSAEAPSLVIKNSKLSYDYARVYLSVWWGRKLG